MNNIDTTAVFNTQAKESRRLLPLIVLGLSALFVLLVALTTRGIVEQQIRADASNLLETHQQSMNSTIERVRHLPTSAVRDKDVIALLKLAKTQDYELVAAHANATNYYLEEIANAADASLFYVIDKTGRTIAANNWRNPNTLLGNNFSFRPYFKNSITGKEAHYLAIGTTTNEAGYYFARPVNDGDDVIGIVVVKMELESLQDKWVKGGDDLILFDEHGVSILASDPQWRFKTLSTELPANIEAIRAENKYAGKEITTLTDVNNAHPRKLHLSDTQYIVSQTSPDARGWTLLHLIPNQNLNAATGLAVLASLLIIGLSGALYLYRREFIRKNKLREAARDAAKLRQLNQQLEAEISDRIQAQQDLNSAQEELIQAGKLAALGQMSAAIVHEVNQPLAAIRTYGASAKLLMHRGETEAVKNNLNEINSLTERLATITTDLKMFSRKPGAARDHISMQKCIEDALQIVDTKLKENDVIVTLSAPDDEIYTLGTATRLGQVITNLLTNAIDATLSRTSDREIKLHLFTDNDQVVLRVSDNGTGLDTYTIEHLFDPFFTTKPSGEGVGLGLAISYGIVQEMGGVIRVRNNEDGGALFSLRLKSAQQSALST